MGDYFLGPIRLASYEFFSKFGISLNRDNTLKFEGFTLKKMECSKQALPVRVIATEHISME